MSSRSDLKERSILLVGNHFSKVGGIPSVAEDLSQCLAAHGFSTLLTSSKRNKLLRVVDMLQVVILKRKRYQVACVDVFSGRAFLWAELVTRVLLILRKPVVLNLHGGGLVEFMAKCPQRVVNLLHSAKCVVTPSQSLQKAFFSVRSDIEYIPNGLFLKRYKFQKRTKLKPRICWLRAVNSIYAPTDAAEAFNNVLEKCPDAILDMIGPKQSTEAFDSLMRMISDYGINSKLQVFGGIRKEDVPTILSKYDIFLNTTTLESFGVGVMEAAAAGLCIVTTDAGELPYLWENGVNALIVPVGDTRAMAEAILSLINDQELCEKLSINARKKSEAFDWEHICPKWIDLYYRIGVES